MWEAFGADGAQPVEIGCGVLAQPRVEILA
jgi:hypothetical protein